MRLWNETTATANKFHDGSGANTIRLSYSLPEPAAIATCR